MPGPHDPQPTTPETRDFDPAHDRKVSGKVHKRLAIAAEVINDVKQINAHAGNQREALKETHGNAAYRGPLLRDPVSSGNWKWTNESAKLLAQRYPEAFFMAKAELLGAVNAPGVSNAGAGGTCWDQAHLAYYFLRIKAAGEPISVVSSPIDHAFTHIGDYTKEDHGDVAVCDAWPTKATACPWDEHFCHGTITRGLNMIADGGGKADDGTDVKEAIKASLSLTAQAQQFIKTTLTEKETDEHLKTGKAVRPGQPVYHHWSNVTTTEPGAEIRSLDPESAGGRYMTEEQIRSAAGEPEAAERE
ncbi:MAG TPA: hypothetical protein VK427_09390 [Kofleriaceae bacterium]|nr:hypothetical protein [Kofleriaceae bacterium]